jgi:AcrR family transcriptional regulator
VSRGEAGSWRELAVARSLDSARTRAESRVQRFLDAALELMESGESNEFTVQEVVERSGQSLRSFYQYFDGKYELLLALFEESVRTTSDHLREVVDEEDEPLARVHRFVTEYHRTCRPASRPKRGGGTPSPNAPVLVDFALQLLTAHPVEAARAFVPLVTLFEEILGEAQASGAIRGDVPTKQVAGVVLESVMFNAFSYTIAGVSLPSRADDAAETHWDLVFRGIAAS